MDYSSILATFKIENEAYISVKGEDDPNAPKINDRDNDRGITRWDPIFKDFLVSSYGLRGPLNSVLREDPIISEEIMDPFLPNCYYGESRRFISELESRLPCGRLV